MCIRFSITNVRIKTHTNALFDTKKYTGETKGLFFDGNVSTTQENSKNYCNFATKALKHPPI